MDEKILTDVTVEELEANKEAKQTEEVFYKPGWITVDCGPWYEDDRLNNTDILLLSFLYGYLKNNEKLYMKSKKLMWLCRVKRENTVDEILTKLSNLGYIVKTSQTLLGGGKQRIITLPPKPGVPCFGSPVERASEARSSGLRTYSNTNISNSNSSSVDEKEKKSNKEKFEEDSIPYQLASLLWESIRANNEKARTPDFQSWAGEIDKMIRIDGLTQPEIEAIIFWCQRDSFWKSNILSASKLREKFPQLWIKAKSGYQQQQQQSKPRGRFIS